MSAPAQLPPEIAAQDKGPSIVIVSCIVTAISTLFVVARLYVRLQIAKKLQLDDAFIVFSLICGWLAVAFSIAAVASGNGKHMGTLSLDQISGAVLWTMVGFIPGVYSFGFPKLAAIALLTKLLNPSSTHRTFLWCLGITCQLALTGCIAILFGQCAPSKAQWDFSITEKTCISPYILVNYSIFAGAFSGFVDLYLAVYPAIVLYSLQMNAKRKFALAFALGLGSVACIVAIYKTTRIPSLASQDFSYDTSDLTIWTCVEGSTIIIATSIPVLRPLADIIFGRRVMGSGGDSRGYSRGYKKYGTDRSNNARDEHELEPKRRKVKHPYDLETNVEVGKDSSQEDILPRDALTTPKKPVDGIIRTKSVMVYYGENDGPLKNGEDWK
ncbi:hypothetical protein GGR54DRAFT_606409 [Hypoxylon sp. NC1633]|nr:hypothetical protein GGR54DRAFT_606409 [Hypoxylon sp. NC1633]